jgi:MFS family permease
MSAYLQRVRAFSPDIKLFLLYNLLANVGFGVIELIFNFYLLELGYREDFIGEWRSVQTVSMAISALTVGVLINRFGVWRSIACGFSVMTAASFLLGLAEQRHLLFALAVVYGAGLAFLFNPLMPFIMEFAETEHRHYASAVSFSIVSLSLMVGSLVGGFAPSFYGRLVPAIQVGSTGAYRAALITGAAIAAMGLIPLLMMKEPRRKRPERAHAAGTEMTSPQRRRLRMDMSIFILAGGLMSIGVGMVQPFYNVFLKTQGASDSQVGYIYALGGLVAAVVGLGAPVLASKMGSLNAVLLLRILIIPFYLPLLFFPSLLLAMLAFLGRQATISMAWPIDSTFIGELLPPRARAGIFGLRSSAWNLGFAIATYIAGKVIVDRGYNPTFMSLIVFSGIAAIVFYSYFSRHPAVVSGQIPSALSRRRRASAYVHPSPLGENVAESEVKVSATL